MNGGTPELPRRALYRYLFDGHMPTPMYRRQIAQALGVPESELPDGEDAEPG